MDPHSNGVAAETREIERVPPRDHESEARLLGSILLDAQDGYLDALRTAEAVVQTGDFDDRTNRTVFITMRSLGARGEPPAAAIVLRELAMRGERIDAAYLLNLAETATTPGNARYLATQVHECAVRREMLEAGEALRRDALRPDARPDRVLADHAERLGKIQTTPALAWRWRGIDALLAEPEEDIVPLWPGLVARRALTLFAAAPKAGKTWLLFAWIGALVRGVGWLDHASMGRSVRVLLVSEEPAFVIKRQARRFGIVTGLDVMTLDQMPAGASWPDTVAAVVRRAREVAAELVVFDTVSTLAGMEDENDAADVNRALRPLLVAARGSDLAVAAVHHAGANGRIRGSTVFEAVPDILVEVRRQGAEGSRRRSLHVRGRLDGVPEAPIVVEYIPPTPEGEPATYRTCGSIADARETSQSKAEEETENRILARLRKKPWQTRAEALAGVVGSNKTKRDCFASLFGRDLLVSRRNIKRTEYAVADSTPADPAGPCRTMPAPSEAQKRAGGRGVPRVPAPYVGGQGGTLRHPTPNPAAAPCPAGVGTPAGMSEERSS